MVPTPRLIAIGLVQHGSRDGEPTYVVTRRPPDVHLGGSWELPGGRLEDGEDPAEALVRELEEELGVAVERPEPLTFSWHDYGDRRVLLLFLGTRTLPTSQPPRPLASTELRLLTRAELLEMRFPPANAPLLRLLERGSIGTG